MNLIRHLPNAVTASRGLMGPAVAWLIVAEQASLAASILFVVASSTDLLDGWLARKLDARTEAGLILDPLSDKLLFGSTWVSLLMTGWAPLWLALPILVRDALVLTAFALARTRNIRFKPILSGRLMTAFEGVSITALLLHDRILGIHWASVGVLLGVMTIALSVGSAFQYAMLGVRALRERHGI